MPSACYCRGTSHSAHATNDPSIAYEGGINGAGNLLSILWLGEQLAWYHVVGIAAIFAGLTMSGKSAPARLRPEPG